MKIPDNLRYTKNDEWLQIDGESASLGITDYAQDQLSDIVYVEALVDVGGSLSKNAAFANVESVKAASEVYAPVDGEVTEINGALANAPEAINSDPYGSWMIKVKLSDPGQVDELMDAAAYQQYITEREG